ncbi:GDSL-type esterase/lipase family protein [Inediibacterium massiliense]|uniref:GDSL-type esterase/lipase family protein n=1 Tax=Inediibacterium massiliense TaxID=1658111 RepID=UPI0006B5DE6E|nr:GDSL-type esterase/lipase family protein [Inediibacterium massiliense]
MGRLRSKKKYNRYKKIKLVVCMILIGFICMMTLWIEKCIADSVPKENALISEQQNNMPKTVKKEDEKIHEQNDSAINDLVEAKKEEKENVNKETIIEDEKQENKKYNYKEIFYKDVFIGDSITNALSFYHLLEDKKVIANLGDTLSKAEKRVDEVAKINPENIFILFGVNDLKAYQTQEEFVKHYERLICKLKDQLPNTNIYVQSILPVSVKAEQKNPYITNKKIESMNGVLMNMCEKNNVTYIHIATVIESMNEDLHEGDGIHFQYKFYPLWLNFLIDYTKEEYQNENI